MIPAEGQAEEQADDGPHCEVIEGEVDTAVVNEGTQAGVLVILVEGGDQQEVYDDRGKRVNDLDVFFPVGLALFLLGLSRVVGRIDRQQEIDQVRGSSSKRKEEGRADIEASKRYD